MVSRADVVARLRARQPLRARDPEVRCDSVQAVLFHDVLDLYLRASRAGRWRWVDPRGRAVEAQPTLHALGHVLRDVAAWPALYLRHRRRVARLRRSHAPAVPYSGEPRALFLRSDHWFNITSGGSVGHLSGVIDGLRELGVRTQVVSSDYLAGVEATVDFHLCEPQYALGRNVPELPELLDNERVLEFVEPRWDGWRPAFVYQRYALGNYAAVVLRERHRVPYVCEYNGSFPWMARHWGSRPLVHERLMTEIELLNLEAADLVVVVSAPMRDELVARGIPAAKILVNPNGVDPVRYSPAVDASAVRARLGLDGRTAIGFIGTFGPWHGAETLAHAYVRLLGERPAYRERTRLLLIGDGDRLPATRAILADAGVEDAVIFTGRIPQRDGPAHLAACDILASPHVPNPDGTPFFGSPTKLFEYMAMGRGIVASDLDQIGEVLEHDRTAWMVPPGDVDALAAGLARLVDDVELRSRLGAEARATVVARYTWRAHTQRILEALCARCAEGGASR